MSVCYTNTHSVLVVVLDKSTNTTLGPSLLSINSSWTTGVNVHECALYKYMFSANGGTLQMLNAHECVLYKYTISVNGGALQIQCLVPACHLSTVAGPQE